VKNLTNGIFKSPTFLKVVTVIIGIICSLVFLAAIFGSYPYPFIHIDPDSIYIFSSLSLLTNHTIEHNDHPGLTLHVAGTLPIALGTIYIIYKEGLTDTLQNLIAQKKAGLAPVEILRGTLIQKVIENMPFFQQVILGLIGLTYILVLIIMLRTFYDKNEIKYSVVMIIVTMAMMLPPTLGQAIGANADFFAFPLSILYALSLFWKRNLKTDLMTSLFFILMIFTKITFIPLGLLMFTVEKESVNRLLKSTFILSVISYFIFWDLNRFIDFIGFLFLGSVSDKSNSLDLALILRFYFNLFISDPVQGLYIVLFISCGILLIKKREFRKIGILGLAVIILSLGISMLRPYKASVYIWPVYATGLLLISSFLKGYPRWSNKVGVIIAILIILSAGILYNDVINLRGERIAQLEGQREYQNTVNQLKADCFLQTEDNVFQLGNAFWLANAYAKREYSPYLEKYFKNRFGFNKMYNIKWEGNGDIIIEDYFSGQSIKDLSWVTPEGCYLIIPDNKEFVFKQNFPQLEYRLIKPISVCNKLSAKILTLKYN
jgi:hypothetical protein